MSLVAFKPFRYSPVLIVVVLLVSGCSGSGDNIDDDSAGVSTPDNSGNEPPNADDSDSISTNTDSEDSTLIVSVPDTPITTQVDFQIVVPVYQSNALQVRMVWGEKDVKATWVGDELWTISESFQMDMEHLLTVTFYDDNGDVVLASYEANYKTGFNDAESYFITADQFDTTRSDDDGDGLSNIAELIAGSDPFADESDLLETVAVDVTTSANFWFSAESQNIPTYYDAELLTLTLPIDINEEVFVDNLPYQSDTKKKQIAISADGNGTYTKSHEIIYGQDAPFRESSVGTRSRDGDTVEWSGTQLFQSSAVRYNGYVKEEFETSNTIGEQTLVHNSNGTITRKEASYESKGNITIYNYAIVLDLDSMDSDNTCAVLTGNFSQTFEQQVDDPRLLDQTVSRSSPDDNWVWISNDNGEISKGEAIEINKRFYCNFLLN